MGGVGMKVSIVRGGGLAGLVTATTVNTEDLGPADAESLRTRVAAARLPELAQPSAQAPSQPDRFSYEVTVEDGADRQTVRVREQDAPAQVRDLIRWVHNSPARRQEVTPPGTAQ
jgi:hypothetical protein